MIDFLVTWVDGSDVEWQKLRDKYSFKKIQNSNSQYREWGLLKYWFRSIEKYAPWVNKIFFVTCGQVPNWLNVNHKKLITVNHIDFIDEKYLPTFSSHAIELNFHNIRELSERFVYFNDDTYLSAPVVPQDFFDGNLPCFSAIMSAITPSIPNDPFVHYLCNDLSVINAHFNKKDVLRDNFFKWYSIKYGSSVFKNLYYGFIGKFTGFTNCHIPSSMLKSVYEEVWQKEPKLLMQTCFNRFRGLNDVNQYVMSYYNACTGKFKPRSPKIGKMFTIGLDDEKIRRSFISQKYKMTCVNDNPNYIDFEKEFRIIHAIMEEAFPQKSEFEL